MIQLELTKDEAKSLEFILDCYIDPAWDDLKGEIEDGHSDTMKRIVDAIRVMDRVKELMLRTIG
jgi:hypothetical protein